MIENKTGFDLKEDCFYIDPKLQGHFYYCEKIDNNIVRWIIIESYHRGRLIQVKFTAYLEGSDHYIEVKNQIDLKRLRIMLEEFRKMEKENEFKKMLESIDEDFKEQNMPIYQRPLRAIREICLKKKISLSCTPRGPAIPGDFEGDSLVAHVHQWYRNKYGDRLKINLSPGSRAVFIKGDVWRINYPLFFGNAKFVFDSDLNKYHEVPKIQKNVPSMIINPLKFIDGFTSEYAKSITRNEMIELKDNLVLGLEAVQSLREIKEKPYIPEAKADLDSAVNNIFSTPPHFGQSKWSSLQFTEKLFKCFLELKEVSFARNHDLNSLFILSNQNGLTGISQSIIQNIQCSAGVRYGEINVSLDEAIQAHESSLTICGKIVPLIKTI